MRGRYLSFPDPHFPRNGTSDSQSLLTTQHIPAGTLGKVSNNQRRTAHALFLSDHPSWYAFVRGKPQKVQYNVEYILAP